MNEAMRRRIALAQEIGEQSIRIEPAAGVGALEELIDETLALVATHLPGFDIAPYRPGAERRRTTEPVRARRRSFPRS